MKKVCLLLVLILLSGCGLEKECRQGMKDFDNEITGEVVIRIENYSYECAEDGQGIGCFLELDVSGRKTTGSYDILASVFEGGPTAKEVEICETEVECKGIIDNEVSEMEGCECEVDELSYACVCWPYFFTKTFDLYRTNYISYSEKDLILEFNDSNIGDYLLSYYEDEMLLPIDLIICE
jgi:hypothetical protein